MDCERCINEQRILALEADKERNSTQHKEFYGALKETAIEGAKSGTTLNQILDTLAKIESKVDLLESKPGKRWESLSMAVLQWAVLAVLAGITFFK